MRESTRREYIGGLAAVAGLSGCLDALDGGGGTGGDDADTDADGTPDSGTLGPKETVRAFYAALDEGRFRAANALMHSNTTEPPVTESRYGPLAEGTVTVASAKLIERGEDRAVVRTVVRASIPGGSGTRRDEVDIELRRENGRWRLYTSTQVGTGEGGSTGGAPGQEPVRGPEAVVREFYRAMDDGNRQAAKALVHSDAPRELVAAQTLDQLERASVTVDDTSIRERTETGVVVTVTLTVTAPDSGRSETTTIALELRMEGDHWRIYGYANSG
ncbi:MAG: hypothetical protein ABEJ94_05435 [Halorientalis sp.]